MGRLLSLKVNGQTIGDIIDLKAPAKVAIEASAVGRVPLRKLELIQNGRVIKTELAAAGDPGRIRFTHEVAVDQPAWFALRGDSGETKNEFEKTIFAHSSPIYVTLKGRGVFEVDDALDLARQIAEGQAAIKDRGRFSNAEASSKLLALYDEAAQILRQRINKRQ